MKYQLVIQFSELTLSFDDLVNLEDALIENLDHEVDVDGHDFGSGEGNIFIFTEDPVNTFENIKKIVFGKKISGMKAAYRPASGGDFVILWPSKLLDFKIK